ncbi:MAG: PAS domain S-box protein [Gammaproteobacteria bacterium]
MDIAGLLQSASVSVYVCLLLIAAGVWLPWTGWPFVIASIGSGIVLVRGLPVVGPVIAAPWVEQLLSMGALWATALVVFGQQKIRERVRQRAVPGYQRLRQRVRERTAQWRALLDTAVDGIIIIDDRGNVEEYSLACERLFGYRAEEVIGRNVKMLMPLPYCDEHDGYLDHYRTTGERRIIGTGREVKGKRKDGTIFPMALSVGEMVQHDKRRFVGIVHDMRVRKAREQVLKDREARLRAVIDTVVDGVIITDSDGIIQDFNPACEKLFGYRAAEVIECNVKILMPPPYHDEHDSYLHRYRVTGERHIIGAGREVQGRRQDGTVFPLELSVGETRQGDSLIFVGIIRDITVRKRTEAALQAAKEQAEVASQAKSLFLANMSHEIRTPMNAVLGYTELLENERHLPSGTRHSIGAIKRAGTHLLELISDILDISKIEAGAEKLDNEDFRIASVIEGLSEIFAVRCEQKKLAWRVETDLEDRSVHGDQRKLRQVLINLVGNAVKFTESGEIKLEVRQAGDLYHFQVVDTGPGISQAVQTRIFEPFQQAAEGVHKGGTGLGLAIAKRQIELMGGSLQVQSQPGSGSRFFFGVPLPPATKMMAQGNEETTRIIGLAQEYRVRALVVDDVEDNRDILTKMLRTLGAEVLTARDGRSALEAIRRRVPDIVFMDMRMPVMGGLETLDRLRAEWPNQRIVCVAVSASGVSHHREHYLQAGFDDFIGKPFSLRQVARCLEHHLGVRFEREPLRQPVPKRRPSVTDFSGVKLSPALHQRLRQAAQLNAFTDIEATLEEIRAGDRQAQAFADHLQALLGRYDRGALLAALEQIEHD